MRVKSAVVLRYITPLVSVIMPLIIMGQLFTFAESFGPWDSTNFFIYQLIAYQLVVVYAVTNAYSSQLASEKVWLTLPALIIAPFRQVYLMIGIYFSFLTVIAFPFIIFFILALIYLPITILTIFAMLFVFFCLSLIFSGIGLFLGVGAISKENIVPYIRWGLSIAFSFSAITLPFEFFPEGIVQNIIRLNPLYYIIDIARLVWIENNFIYSITHHPFHLFVLLSLTILLPILGYKFYDYIFKKYGIVGY